MVTTRCRGVVWPAVLLLLTTGAAFAQVTGGGGGTGGGTGGGGTGGGTGGNGTGTGTSGGTGVAGVWIDADGVLSLTTRPVVAGSGKARSRVKRPQQPMARSEVVAGPFQADDNRDVAQPAVLRVVSLARLEQAIRPFSDAGKAVPQELEYLAGLRRIDAVLALPEQHDIVLVGPADDVQVDPWGRGMSGSTGTPALKLEDLVVLLRASSEGEFGCSIDPEPSRLADLNRYLQQNNGPSTAAAVKARLSRLDEILGLQNVRIFGLPGETHAASVFVEADYVMKRVGLGLDRPPVKGFKSHLAMASPGGNSMQRWWFTPRYEPFVSTDNRTAWSFAGPRVQLLTERELVDGSGRRFTQAGLPAGSSDAYARQFNEHFDELARHVPSFAELRGLFDLTLAVALIRRERWQAACELPLALLLDESKLTVAQRPVPRQVRSLANLKVAGGAMVIAQVGGGVSVRPQAVMAAASSGNEPGQSTVESKLVESKSTVPGRAAAETEATVTARLGFLKQLTAAVTPPGDAERWWWDLRGSAAE